MKARRFETLHDTTLWKVHKPTRVLQSTGSSQVDADTAETKATRRMLQIDIQRWIRSITRYLRENASAESPCNYGYAERIVHQILSFLGCPLWHEDQLHLAEWQALQQIEYLFNLTLSVDAKNIALEKLKAHKRGTNVHAEATDLPEPMNRPRNADDDELQDVADAHLVMDELPQDDKTKGVVLPVTDKAALLRLLSREVEVALARQPGQGRREALQCMREASDAYQTPEHSQTNATDPSVFGASEHRKQAALARHRQCLQKLREGSGDAPVGEIETEDAKQASSNEAGVALVTDEDLSCAPMSTMKFAKYLCDAAELTTEQRGPVALIARDMQDAYETEVARRASLTERQMQAEGIGASEHITLPRKGRRLRLLLYGGGGCGKTRIINCVLAKLFRRFYGEKGLVLTAFSNKASRLINGKTSHTLTKIRGGQSLTMAKLRVLNDKERRALAAVWAPAGALVKDEFTQQPGPLEHAIAVRATYGRERFHNLRCADYAQPETNYASLPYVITAGDPLQFPPVPATSSLLAEPDGQTKEHRIAQSMFEDQDYVCELKTTMRFRGVLF